MNDEQIKLIRDLLKEKIKENICDIAKDIIDTSDELLKRPFDYDSAKSRMGFNYGKYEIIPLVKRANPKAQLTAQLSPQEVVDNLKLQLSYLYNKYMEEQNNG